MNETSTYQVVVGVDGSPPSKAALRWAIWHARQVGGSVLAVTAWNTSTFYNYDTPTSESYTRNLKEALAQAAEETARDDAATVEQRVVRDHPAWALIAAAKDADLLVVGSRGHGGFAGALLGSVSQHCVQHATCPVVVVRDDRR